MPLTDTNLISRDLQHLWHPCSQMKDYEIFKPLVIKRAQGSYIELTNGKKIIDAISSWWCKSLGHNHPQLKQALLIQLEKFEHVILANTTHESIVQLSEKLTALAQTLKKVFYVSDGACAIEIALKMSLHARKILGEYKKQRFVALANGYHGETMGALSVSDVGIYRAAYRELLFDVTFLSSIPYVSGKHDPLWHNCQTHWEILQKQLEPLAETTTAIVIEPIVQGAGGMLLYSQDLLKRLRAWTKAHGIHLIADEIMTGIGRTGKMLACEHANIEPDFLCLGKGLTSGWLPLSAMLTSHELYNLFYADYAAGKNFLHSHTHSGNALAVSVALETLNIMERENICARVLTLENNMLKALTCIAEDTGKLINVRGIGAIVAADLVVKDSHQRAGFAVYQKAVKLGALLRPLGNTIYWLPPLNIDYNTLSKLSEITRKAIQTTKF
jgi:adenosylmethionine---8-amino-7-oxononanoate aminotransferase